MGQRTLARAGHTREHEEPLPGQGQVDAAQIVLAGAHHGDAGRRMWPGASADLITDLSAAVAAGHWVRLTHRSGAGRESRRRVDPYRLVVLRQRWYLFDWDRDRRDWRSFRLDRVGDLTLTHAPYTRREPPAEDLAAYLERRFEGAPRGHVVTVLFHASAAEVAARLIRVDGSLVAVGPDAARYVGWVDSHEWMALALTLTGLDFRVEGPVEFARRVAEISERLGRAVTGEHGSGRAPSG